MSPRSRRLGPGDPAARGGRDPAARGRGDSSFVFAGGLFVLAVLAIATAGWLNRAKKNAERPPEPGASEEEVYASPFGDLAPEDGPPKLSPGGEDPEAEAAPADLLEEPLWKDALHRAEAVWELVAEAGAAEEAGDTELFLEKALAARDIADQLLFDTAEWVTEVQESYPAHDPSVRTVTRQFQRWTGVLRKYHGLSRDG